MAQFKVGDQVRLKEMPNDENMNRFGATYLMDAYQKGDVGVIVAVGYDNAHVTFPSIPYKNGYLYPFSLLESALDKGCSHRDKSLMNWDENYSWASGFQRMYFITNTGSDIQCTIQQLNGDGSIVGGFKTREEAVKHCENMNKILLYDVVKHLRPFIDDETYEKIKNDLWTND